MRFDQTLLYEKFVRARQTAVELTDRYNATPTDAAERDALWEQVVSQTESARRLLVAWLGSGADDCLTSTPAAAPVQEPALIGG
jgi:hypothetical protein